MSYVTQYENDVFVSYAHNDDPLWIDAFGKSLEQELAERLGRRVSLWQDTHQLRLGHDWGDGLRGAIESTAVFIAILSPSYQQSDWCGRERAHFRQAAEAAGTFKINTKSGNAYRFLKVIKLPWEDDAHLQFFPEAQHLELFERDPGTGIEDELAPGTEGFRSQIRLAAHAISSLLKAMRRRGEPVFLASTPEELHSEVASLRAELLAQGYDARPEGPIDSFFSDAAVADLIEPAVLTVHALGRELDEQSRRQAEIACRLEKQTVFWLAGENGSSADHQAWIQQQLKGRSVPDPTILVGSYRKMIHNVLQLLTPRASGPVRVTNGSGASVYLLHDPSVAEDSEFARQLGGQLEEQEGLGVVLPEVGALALDAHRQHLRSCDGLLLYRNAAPIEWFRQSLPDVLLAERDERARPLRSKAFLLDDPTTLAGQPDVIPRTDDFQLTDLESFLAPLRLADGGGQPGV